MHRRDVFAAANAHSIGGVVSRANFFATISCLAVCSVVVIALAGTRGLAVRRDASTLLRLLHGGGLFAASLPDPDTCVVAPHFDAGAATTILRESNPTAYENTSLCEDLGRACVIGDALLLYDERFQPRPDAPYAPPTTEVGQKLKKLMYHVWWRGNKSSDDSTNPDALAGTLRFDFDRALRVFPGGSAGAKPPVPFSQCTLPLALFWDFPENYFHTLAAYASLWHAVRRGAISADTSLALGLPFPSEARPFIHEPLATFMRRRATTLSHFAADALASHPRGGGSGEAVHFSKPPVRCFARVGLCSIPTYTRQPPEGMYEFMQAVKAALLHLPPNSNASLARRQPYALPGLPRPFLAEDGSGVVRVTLALRARGGRRLLNLPDVEKACDGAELRVGPVHGRPVQTVTLRCTRHVWGGGLAAEAAAMQRTDVLISTHGAGLANMGFLRPGASVIELRSAKFKPSNSDRFYRPLAVHSGAVKWWGVLTYGAHESPGSLERRQAGNPDAWPRDRDLTVPWRFIDSALQRVLPLTHEEWRGVERDAQTDAIP